jgi:spore cortex formation protein SpoVR/YcgB (stage V sporulation)
MKEIIIGNEASVHCEGKLNSKHCKPVVAIKTDGSEFKFFTSIQDAAEKLGINANYISTCMNDEKPCKGWNFIPLRKVLSVVDTMADIMNRNVMDAQKWRAQEAEKERIRLEEERRQENIARLKARVAHLDKEITKCSEKYRSLVDEYNTATMELEALEDVCSQED